MHYIPRSPINFLCFQIIHHQHLITIIFHCSILKKATPYEDAYGVAFFKFRLQ